MSNSAGWATAVCLRNVRGLPKATSAIIPLPEGVTLSAAERGPVSGTSVASAAVE